MIAPASLSFLASAAVVVAAGVMLGKAAERIANLSGLGRIWTGAALLAVATSVPELVTDISAVRMGAPNLAAGDLFGSNLTNMLILALIGLLPADRRTLEQDASGGITACLAILLNALVLACIVVRPQFALGGVRPESALLPVVYLFGMRVVYRRAAAGDEQNAGRTLRERFAVSRNLAKSLARPSLVFVLGAILIFFAAPVMAGSAERLAQVSGLGNSFVGTWLLGLTTALPELVTSLTAAMSGAAELGVANLFGSCAFNMVIFFAMDLVYPKGSVFSALDHVHVLTGSLSIALMVFGLASVVYRHGQWLKRGSMLTAACYAFSIALVFAYTR
jgi:cation:H+ antiporter